MNRAERKRNERAAAKMKAVAPGIKNQIEHEAIDGAVKFTIENLLLYMADELNKSRGFGKKRLTETLTNIVEAFYEDNGDRDKINVINDRLIKKYNISVLNKE